MSSHAASSFSLASLPPIYILPTHIPPDKIHAAEEDVRDHDGLLTYNAQEARIFLGRISQKKRASFELRARGVWTEEDTTALDEPTKKRRKLLTSRLGDLSGLRVEGRDPPAQEWTDRVLVLNLNWLYDSLKQHEILPFEKYITYIANIVAKPSDEQSPTPLPEPVTYIKAPTESTPSRHLPDTLGWTASSVTSKTRSDAAGTILTRAKAEADETPNKGHPMQIKPRRRFNQSTPTLTHPHKPPRLYRTTTSEFEGDPNRLPEPPEWVRDHNVYSCFRSTPLNTPNAAFIEQLQIIKEARLLTLDEIGVRAYSTSIASIAAYPYLIQSETEILRLPGCEQKIASLWSEWDVSAESDSGRYLDAVRAIENDEDLKHLRLFYEIWGVGADTARRFYFDRGWKEIDDIVEFGWSTLNRVQQIGVKFYDEFQEKIPRAEVEAISEVIHKHARSCRGIPESDWDTDRDMELVIVGGYRRGKDTSGDVDVILSHRDEKYTKDMVVEVVASLEEAGWITHTLTLNTTTSNRNQQTLPYRGEGHGHGFDSLDKALCVWQDPNFDDAEHENNPNIHRRVDIIISSWRTVGCAVLGWSGGTTFQRDIRRWVKRSKGWKFDSSGVRDRATGYVLDLESPRKDGDGDTWLDREKRLMEGLGIGWRPASQRCTG